MSDVWRWIIGAAVSVTALAVAYRTAVRPVIRGIRRMIRIADQVGAVVLGDRHATDARGRPAPVPSLAERLGAIDETQAEIRQWQTEHQTWHAGAGRSNGGTPVAERPRQGRPGGRI